MNTFTHITRPERLITGVNQMGHHHWQEFPKGTPVVLDPKGVEILPYMVIRRDKFFNMVWAEFFTDLATARKCLMDEIPGIRRDKGGNVRLKHMSDGRVLSATWRNDGVDVVL